MKKTTKPSKKELRAKLVRAVKQEKAALRFAILNAKRAAKQTLAESIYALRVASEGRVAQLHAELGKPIKKRAVKAPRKAVAKKASPQLTGQFTSGVHETKGKPTSVTVENIREFYDQCEQWHGRVIIGSLMQHYAMTVADFKSQLLALHQKRLVALSRFDLVSALSVAQTALLDRGRIQYLSGTYDMLEWRDRYNG
jgi:hypothetical protein